MSQLANHQQQLSEEMQMQEDEEFLEQEPDGDDQQQQEDPNESPSESPPRQPSPPTIDNSQVYQAFGRDTAAGRALFKLYNKNKVSYTPEVAIKTKPSDPQQDAADKKRREAAALIKRKYQPPKLKKAEKEEPVGRVPLWGGKKTTDTITRENERDAPLYKAPSIPLSKLQQRDVEKAKLQEAYKPKSKVIAPLPGRGKVVKQVQSKRDPNQVLYDQIIEEIDDRHKFLDSMRSLGDTSHEAAIKAEIAHRLRDLKKLELLMAQASLDSMDAPSSSTTIQR